MARALRRQLENCDLPQLSTGQLLFPGSNKTLYRTRHNILNHSYSFSISYQPQIAEELAAKAASDEERQNWQAVLKELNSYPIGRGMISRPRYTLGGDGYTHSIPNFGRVIMEGLQGHAARIEKNKTDAQETGPREKLELMLALEDVMAGVNTLIKRIFATLEQAPASPERDRLLAAYNNVPLQPAQSFFEAVITTNFVFYLDDCDSLGCMDKVLGEIYQRDLQAGKITREQAVELMREFWRNFNCNSAWNVVLGGTDAEGNAAYNAFTNVCLEAAKGIRRPNLALKIRPDMQHETWQAALDALESGCGLPALYNDDLYMNALACSGLGIAPQDICDYAFGGCTETMMHANSNCGSLDAGLNLLEVLLETVQAELPTCQTFEQLMEAFCQRLSTDIVEMTLQVNRDHEHRTKWRPQLMRTLLIDDCIDKGMEFNAGGARYNWSAINVGGLANVADSLAAIRELVFRRRRLTGAEYLSAMSRNYSGGEALLAEIAQCPRFGNDDSEADSLARELSNFVFREMLAQPCKRGGKFLPSCLLFATYAQAGERLGASPDGRKAHEAIADSIGPYGGRDTKGPTAMLKSVSSLDHASGLGTLVLNVRLDKASFKTPSGRRAIISLIQGFFKMGGMQLQVSVLDQDIIRDAIAHPDRHGDLIVRIGGYSEYFNSLSGELKQTILERTEHRV